MKCPKCSKEINRQLVLYNGTLACPICKCSLFDTDTEFLVTKENEELYVQSEVCFFKGLKGQNQQAYYKKCVSLAEKAALLGHPMAIYKMGYYYSNNFVTISKPNYYKAMIAYEYYKALAYSDVSMISNEDAIKKYDLEKIKMTAASDILNMLASYENDKRIEKYSIRYNFEKLKNIYPSIKVPSKIKEGIKIKRKKVYDRILELLLFSLKSKEKVVYGLFKLTGSEFKELLTREKDEENVFLRILRSKTYTFGYVTDYKECERFEPLNEKEYDYCLEEAVENINHQNYLFVFFNRTVSIPNINSKKLQVLEKTFLKYDNAISLIDGAQATEYVFFLDDILEFLKKDDYKKAILSLIESVSLEE